jgi:hypothetical protein
MELHEYKHNTSKEAERFRWWGATYVQWHPLAVALAELCAQTRGPLVERGWRIVESVYPKWALVVADSKRGALWRPIRKLYKKAKGARAAALKEDAVAKDQAEAFQKLELLDSGRIGMLSNGDGIDLTTPLPPQQPQQTVSAVVVDAMPDAMDFSNGSDFNAFGTSFLTNSSGLMDFEIPASMASGFFADTTTGWPDAINFDLPLDNTVDPMNWTVWTEFINDTNADGGSRTGSSEDG